MPATAVAFVRTQTARVTRALDLPYEPAAAAYIDDLYLGSGHILAYRLEPREVEFRGRRIAVRRLLFLYVRANCADVAIELDDPEAAGYLAQFEGSASAASAELFSDGQDRVSVHRLLNEVAELVEGLQEAGGSTFFGRVVFHRAPVHEIPEGHEGFVGRERLVARPKRLDVYSDTTVLADARIGYLLLASFCARTTHLARRLIRSIDDLLADAVRQTESPAELLRRATTVQQRAMLVERELTAHGLLAPTLVRMNEAVAETLGLSRAARNDVAASLRRLTELVIGLHARTFDQTVRDWGRAAVAFGTVSLILATIVTLTLLGADRGEQAGLLILWLVLGAAIVGAWLVMRRR